MPKVRTESDEQLIKKIRLKACNESFLKLFERHKKIYYNVCSFYTRGNSVISYSEMCEDAQFVVNWAIQNFDESKNTKFSTFLYIYSRCHCLNQIKKKKKNGEDVFALHENYQIDLLLNSSIKYSGTESTNNSKNIRDDIFAILNNMKDQRIKTIFEMRFYGDKEDSKWKNISSKLNLTPQRVYTLYNKGKEYLIKNYNR